MRLLFDMHNILYLFREIKCWWYRVFPSDCHCLCFGGKTGRDLTIMLYSACRRMSFSIPLYRTDVDSNCFHNTLRYQVHLSVTFQQNYQVTVWQYILPSAYHSWVLTSAIDSKLWYCNSYNIFIISYNLECHSRSLGSRPLSILSHTGVSWN